MIFGAPFLARTYDFPALDGAGQRVALVEVGDAVVLDEVEQYCAMHALRVPAIRVVPETSISDGRAWTPGVIGPTTAAQVCASLLPAAEIVVHVVDGTELGILNGLRAAILHSDANVVCVNLCEPEAVFIASQRNVLGEMFLAASLMGITICCPAQLYGDMQSAGAPFPAASEHVLAVGGSTLVLTETGPLSGEYASATYPPFSTSVEAPPWQLAATTQHRLRLGAHNGRALPDVVACDSCDVRIDGALQRVRAPSVPTIIWGALLALTCQQLGKRLGLITADLWGKVGPAGALHPVATRVDVNNGKVEYVPPWAPWSGWGSPNGATFLPALLGK